MKKEDYQSVVQGTPIDLIFIPEAVQVQFKDKVKLQIAFYRNSKVCKSTPVKFTKANNPNTKLILQPQQLSFCTTISYDEFMNVFQSKIIDVQLAIQIDGQKVTLDGQIDLAEILVYKSSYQTSNLILHFKNHIKLFYGVKSKIINQSNVGNYQIASMKTLIEKSPAKFNPDPNIERFDRKNGKAKGINFNLPDLKQNDDSRAQNYGLSKASKSQRAIRQVKTDVNLQKHEKIQKQLQQKIQNANQKVKTMTQQNKQLKAKIQYAQSINDKRLKQIHELEKTIKSIQQQKIKISQQITDNNVKNEEKQAIQKKAHIIQKLTMQIKDLKDSNSEYKSKIQEMKRMEIDYKSKYSKMQQQKDKISHQLTNIISKGDDKQEICKRNNIIERLNIQIESLKELNAQYKIKLQQTKRNENQFRFKYQQSQKKNVKLTSQISESHYSVEKMQRQNQKLEKQIEKLQKKTLNDSMVSDCPKTIMVDEHKLKQKEIQVQKLTKLIQTKEETIKLLKKQNEMKKQEQNQDILFLKKQNKQLKEQVDKLKQAKKDTSMIQLKIMNQKLKKQCQEAKRQEKKMMVERSQIEARSKQFQQEIVKLKQSLAKIINIVQQEGSHDLYTHVGDCLS